MLLKQGSKGDDVLRLQQALITLGYDIDADGVFGPGTASAVEAFQTSKGLTADAVAGPATLQALGIDGQSDQPSSSQPASSQPAQPGGGSSKQLAEADYEQAAAAIGCEVAVIKTVTGVESSGSGFLADGRAKILFEAKWFSQFTNHQYDASHPNISSKTWNKSLYKGGAAEYTRLDEAQALNAEAALKSASYGLFQIMGFNFAQSGFPSVQAYVDAVQASAGAQLMSFVNLVKTNKWDKYLLSKNWTCFAYRYNGGGFKQNQYDKKLSDAYFKLTGVRTPTSTTDDPANDC